MRKYLIGIPTAIALSFLLYSGVSAVETSLYPNRGGTGTTTIPTYGQLLVGNNNGTYSLMATSTLGITSSSNSTFATSSIKATSPLNWDIPTATMSFNNPGYLLTSSFGTPFYQYLSATTTDALTEGSTNKYFTQTNFDNKLSATSSVDSITTLSNLSIFGGQVSNLNTLWDNRFAATTTTGLNEGSNLYYTSARVNSLRGATTTVSCSGGTNCSAFVGIGGSPIDISSFSYPFPNNATSTSLTLTGLTTMSNASTTGTQTVNQLCFPDGLCMSTPSIEGSAITLYPWNATIDIPTYEGLRTIPDSLAQVDESCSATAGYCAAPIDNYVSTSTISATGALSLTKIPAGTWTFDAYTYVNSALGTSVLEFTVYRRTSLGVETQMFQATSTDINITSPGLVEFNSTQLGFSFNPTDRLVVRVKGWTDSGSAKIIHWLYEGMTRYSHITTPITLASEAVAFLPADNTFTGTNIFGKATFTHATTTYLGITNLATAAGTFLAANADGTIIATTTPGGSGTVTSVSGSGGTTGLTLTGGPITGIGTLTLGGTLAIANGGTNLTSVGASSTVMISDGSVMKFNKLVTSQLTNDSGFLTSAVTSANYPLTVAGSVMSLALSTTTSNTWGGVQTIANASTTQLTTTGTTYLATTGGNVGIGTTGPNYKLEVNGSASSTSLVLGTPLGTQYGGTGQNFSASNGLISLNAGVASAVATSTLNLDYYPSFSYATSTAWTGTTTIALAPAYVTETWKGVKCFTDAGTLNVSFNDGTNRMDMFNASTTVGQVSLITNNAFTVDEKRYVDIGTPATTPTKISCSVKINR